MGREYKKEEQRQGGKDQRLGGVESRGKIRVMETNCRMRAKRKKTRERGRWERKKEKEQSLKIKENGVGNSHIENSVETGTDFEAL